jgi:hypothetical protein
LNYNRRKNQTSNTSISRPFSNFYNSLILISVQHKSVFLLHCSRAGKLYKVPVGTSKFFLQLIAPAPRWAKKKFPESKKRKIKDYIINQKHLIDLDNFSWEHWCPDFLVLTWSGNSQSSGGYCWMKFWLFLITVRTIRWNFVQKKTV